MSNIFRKFQSVSKKPKRSTFDLTFDSNITTKFGQLMPVFCEEVNPGDSVRINPTFGLNLAPFLYPVQTKIKAHLHFFYVRNRALWSDWMDFIGNTKEGLIPPYMNFEVNKHLLKNKSLADNLGLPTSYIKSTGNDLVTLPIITPYTQPGSYTGAQDRIEYVSSFRMGRNVTGNRTLTLDGFEPQYSSDSGTDTKLEARWFDGILNFSNYDAMSELLNVDGLTGSIDNEPAQKEYLSFANLATFTSTPVHERPEDAGLTDNQISIKLGVDGHWTPCRIRVVGLLAFIDGIVHKGIYVNEYVDFQSNIGTLNFSEDVAAWLTNIRYSEEAWDVMSHDITLSILYDCSEDYDNWVANYGSYNNHTYTHSVTIPYKAGFDEVSSAEDSKLYDSDIQPISALPFRAYEMIYNSFYRNAQNNPLIIDGTPEYNKYLRNTSGGIDNERYDYFNRNWDDDVFTTAVQSPQQGYAPLVGITSYGEMTFQDENGTYKVQANVGSDGDTIESISIQSPDMPPTTARALVDMVSSGIAISDLRNVNALQSWLEKNMRRGLRYKDQMESHFGANVEYDELLIPQFIGGVSKDIEVNRIINTTQSEEAPLGSYAGLGQCFGSTRNSITHYADEHGFIVGILSVVPYASYSQVLPRKFTRFNVLDYFFPEFNHIGMQPVYYKDIAPLQVADTYKYADNETIKARLNDVFGYNRPYFDYISKVDEVHGDFRDKYHDYLLHRVFKNVPYLSPDFVTINDSDLNDVWAVSEETDKILGLIHFDFKRKTTVSEFALPRLEN